MFLSRKKPRTTNYPWLTKLLYKHNPIQREQINMKCYIDDFFNSYDPESKEFSESMTLLFATGKEFDESNFELTKIIKSADRDNENKFEQPVYGINVTHVIENIDDPTYKNNNMFNLNNWLSGNLDGNWIEVSLRELLADYKVSSEGNIEALANSSQEIDYETEGRIVNFVQEIDYEQEGRRVNERQREDQSRIPILFYLSLQYYINSRVIKDRGILDLLNETNTTKDDLNPVAALKKLSNPTHIELLYAGFGNATRLSCGNECLYYDYGSKNNPNSIGIRKNTIDKPSTFIISHWDYDHYSGLLNLTNKEKQNVTKIIGKGICPSTKSFKDLQNAFPGKITYINFAITKGGKMSLDSLYKIANISIFKTGPSYRKNGTLASNKAELILRIDQPQRNVYLTGDSMWNQLLILTDQNNSTFFCPSPQKKQMFVIPHHGGNAGGFSCRGKYQKILINAKNIQYAISVDPNCFRNVPSYQTSKFFSNQKGVFSTMPIRNWKSTSNSPRNVPL